MGLMGSTPVRGRHSDLWAPWENNHGAATQRARAPAFVHGSEMQEGGTISSLDLHGSGRSKKHGVESALCTQRRWLLKGLRLR